jgi:peptidyl-prolyl cis-trans isomerase C
VKFALPRAPRTVAGRVALAVLPPLVLLGVIAFVSQQTGRLPSDAAFRVYGTVVTKAELAQRVKVLGALYGLRAPDDPARLDAFNRDTAQSMAESLVLDRAADDRHIVITDQQSRQALDNLIAHLSPPGEASFITLLRNTRAAQADVLDELKRQARVAELYRRVTDPAAGSVTETDIGRYYQQHQAQLATPEQRHLRNIVVATEPEADQIMTELRGGADFASEAQRSSLDQATSAAGGDLGFVAADQLVDGYAQAAFGAPKGGLFGPAHTSDGWDLGQVLDIRPSVPATLAQVHNQLDTQLRQDRAGQAWQSWIAQQLAQAGVRYAPGYQPEGAPPPPGADPVNHPGPVSGGTG